MLNCFFTFTNTQLLISLLDNFLAIFYTYVITSLNVFIISKDIGIYDVTFIFYFRRVMIILDLTVLHSGSEVGMKIGNPVTFPEGGPEQGAQKKVAPVPSSAPAVSPIKTNSNLCYYE